jgi:F0F1-type ATP synthase assembly protein I
MDRGRGDRDSRRDAALSTAEFAGLGIEFALAILIFALLGHWLDGRLGTTPWLLIILIFAGAGGAFYSMFRRVMAAQRRDEERRRAAKRGDGGKPDGR